MRKYIYYLVLTGFYLLTFMDANAQDIHYAQYFNSPMNINPGLTGIFNGDMRIAANYRNQWNAGNVHYNTFTGGFESKIPKVSLGNGYVAGGVLVNFDHAGDSKLRFTQLGLSGSYTHQLAKAHFLSLGVQGAVGNRRFAEHNLNFEDEWDGSPTDEVFPETSYNVFDLNAGLNYHFQKPSKRTKADIGAALFHINSPEYGFRQNLQDKFSRFVIHGIAEFQVAEKWDLILNGIYQDEGPHEEIIVGGAARYHLSFKTARELALRAGVHYRTEDAFYPHFQIDWRNLSLGLSYDVNISDYTEASNRRGGPEVYFMYLITKVKPSNVKICPIY